MPFDQHGFILGDAPGLLGSLMNHSGDCVKIVDLDGTVLSWNAACEDLYGWSAAEAVGKTMPHVPEELRLRVVADIRGVAASGRVVEREAEAIRSDGTRVSVSLVVLPVHDEDGHPSGVMSIAKEIAGDSRLERERAEFLSNVEVALRGPLSAVISSGQLLARPEIACDANRRSRAVETLLENARAAGRAVDELLVVSNLHEPGRMPREPVDLYAVTTDAVHAIDYAEDRVLIEFDGCSALLLGDPALLSRAISDMVEVALSVSDERRAVVGLCTLRGEAHVVVEARGASEPQADAADDGCLKLGSSETGMGPGLARASAVARSHGGCIEQSLRTDVFALEMRLPIC